MALGLADLLGTFGWAVVAKPLAAWVPGEDSAALWGLCGPTCIRTQPTGLCWVAPFDSLLLPIPKKGYEDSAENYNTLQAFWPVGRVPLENRGCSGGEQRHRAVPGPSSNIGS